MTNCSVTGGWGLAGTASHGRLRARDVLPVGPRGVGKTALLGAYAAAASESDSEVVNLQATLAEEVRADEPGGGV